MIGIEFSAPEVAEKVCNTCYERGLLVLDCGVKSIRMAPPLIITREQADLAVDMFAKVCREVAG